MQGNTIVCRQVFSAGSRESVAGFLHGFQPTKVAQKVRFCFSHSLPLFNVALSAHYTEVYGDIRQVGGYYEIEVYGSIHVGGASITELPRGELAAMPRKKVDQRIRVVIENAVVARQRSMVVVVGEKAKDQVVLLHHILSKASVKARPSLLWCYKKDLGFSRWARETWPSIT